MGPIQQLFPPPAEFLDLRSQGLDRSQRQGRLSPALLRTACFQKGGGKGCLGQVTRPTYLKKDWLGACTSNCYSQRLIE